MESSRAGYTDAMSNHDEAREPNPDEPLLAATDSDDGPPPPLVDTPQNMPGDQPVDDTPPSRTKATGDA